MIPDGEYVAVLDRFEDDMAVLLVEDDEETVAELPVPRWRLPEDARHQDALFQVAIRNGILLGASYDEEATSRRARDAQDRFDRLSQRAPHEDERSEAPDRASGEERSDEP